MAQTEISKSAAAQALAVRSSCIICVITVSETLLATVIFPFVYEMVGEFIGKGNIYIGFWAGLISCTHIVLENDSQLTVRSLNILHFSDNHLISLGVSI